MAEAFIVRRGGVGIAFAVVGGTTQPSNPKENTVWVNTSTSIPNTYVQAFEPDSPTVGDVWINTWYASDGNGNAVYSEIMTVTITKNPFIRIAAKSGKQWNGTEWVQLATRVYKNGTWSPDLLVILMDGSWGPLGHPTKGYHSNSITNDTYTFSYNDGYMYLKSKSEGAGHYRIYIETSIDVTPYNTMTAVGYTISSLCHGWIFLNKEIKGSTSVLGGDSYYTEDINSASATNPLIVTSDISSAEGKMYFGLGISSNASSAEASCYFKEITLSI